MVKTLCKMLVRSGDIEKFKEAAREQVRAFRCEPGNDFYTLNEEIGSDRKFAIIAGWDNAEAAQQHCASGGYEAIREKLAPMCLEMDEIKTMECPEGDIRTAAKGGDNLTVLMPGVMIYLEKGRDMEIYQELRC